MQYHEHTVEVVDTEHRQVTQTIMEPQTVMRRILLPRQGFTGKAPRTSWSQVPCYRTHAFGNRFNFSIKQSFVQLLATWSVLSVQQPPIGSGAAAGLGKTMVPKQVTENVLMLKQVTFEVYKPMYTSIQVSETIMEPQVVVSPNEMSGGSSRYYCHVMFLWYVWII